MPQRYIDFISAYCDSWCERCAFTERCSHFAVKSAIAMCDGNFDAAMELAIGPPRSPRGEQRKSIAERMADAFDGYEEPTQKELDEIGRELDERRRRIERIPIAEASLDYAVATHRWLDAHNRCENHPDARVRAAIETISWDSHLIYVKIMRALDGRDECPNGEPFWKSAEQSDWNGSAKVALISIERSEPAWRVVAGATTDEAAVVIADSLAALRLEVTREFPHAMTFKRPGFDDVRRAKR